MSIYIGLPGITIKDASIEVAPDHIEFGTGDGASASLSIYLSTEQMRSLGAALVDTAQANSGEARRRMVYPSSFDACTDAIADLLQRELEGLAVEVDEDVSIDIAAKVMKLVERSMLLHQPGTFAQEALSL